jgi:hypothetical protein
MTKGLLVAICCLLLTVPASAGPAPPLDFQGTGFQQSHQTLEKYNVWPQPTDPAQLVIDPTTNCTWDINEHSEWTDTGSLAPGATASTQTCVVWGYNPMYVARNGLLAWYSSVSHWHAVSITGPQGLNVQVCYATPARCFTVPSKPVDRTYQYSFCSQVVYQPGDPALTLIPGSTPDPLPWGSAPGEGSLTTVTISVSNPTGRTAKDILARWGMASDHTFPPGCSQTHPAPSVDYPFSWYSL